MLSIVWLPLAYASYRIYIRMSKNPVIKLPLSHNCLFFYSMIALAIVLQIFLFGRFDIPKFLGIFFVIFALHEIQWYVLHLQLFKDELQSTSDFYYWCNQFNDVITTTEATEENAHDFSEGIFNGDFSISNGEAMKNKYDLYYDYLKLKPGMKVLDIGCGNGHWGYYLKKRGVDVTGIVISKDNYNECIKKGIRTILGDARIVVKNMAEKFDAISAIGPVEHFCSLSQSNKKRFEILNEYFRNVVSLIDPNSPSKMYLNSIMTSNLNYSKRKSLGFLFHYYLIASAFGSGFYPFDTEIEAVYQTKQSKIVEKRDYTEDYRYIFVRDQKYLGNFRWQFNTRKRLFSLIKSFLTDPYCLHRILFGKADSWLWQFGGTQKKPMPENHDTPVRAYIYVVQIVCENNPL